MKHHVVISEEVVEERGLKSREGIRKITQEVAEREGESSSRRRDQAKEYYEKKTRVTKPIALDDLFKRRSLKPGDPESEVRRVLLYGNPGSGKTCITKAVAHKWALGEMAEDLNAVYVVPVRVLNSAEHNGQKWTRLEEAISQICFSGSKLDFDSEDLAAQVKHDLDDPATMLMVDGLDEANESAIELLSTIWERSCKVLLLSRPYNMRNVETRVDIQVECLGFNDQQLRDYVESELSEDDAPRLIRSLENSSAMWEMAHIPVTAHILCSLSKEHGTSIEEHGERASVFQIYNDMANYVWKRFKTKPTATNVKRSELFGDLEKIAFETLRKGLILIPPRLVTRYATSTDAAGIFKESGLLLLVLEGREYQFPHLTFQEYFAGRHIAKSLRNLGSDERIRVLDFIHEEKYNQKHALSLSFAMHAYAEGGSKLALQRMLSIIDEDPIEVLGIQHFFLKIRVLEAVLQETDEDDVDDLLNDEQAIKLAENARQLLECTIDDVLIRGIIVENFQEFSLVLERSPRVLNDTIDEVKRMLVSEDDLTQMETEKVTDVLKLARRSLKNSKVLVQFVLQRVEETKSWRAGKKGIERLTWIIEHVPQHAGEVLPTLAKGCVDEDSGVRRYSMEAIGRVVAAAPDHAGEVLPTLAKGRVDEDSGVRHHAIEAIGRVVAAAPDHAGDVLRTLAKGCVDEDSGVRHHAIEAIGRVVAAASDHAGEVLPTLAKGCVDEDSGVRRDAMEAIGRVVAAASDHAGEVLPMLAKGCVDEVWGVRCYAITDIGRVVEAAPDHAGDVLPTLAKGCVDEDSGVRRYAMEAIGRVVAAAPDHAGEVLPTLAKGCVDEDSGVRRYAMEATGRVVAAAPDHAGEVLPTLAKGCVDEDSGVRRDAMEAIGRVVAAAPDHAGEVLPTLAKGCVDEDLGVRCDAIKAISRVVAAAPDHAGDVLPTMAKGCVNEDSGVRRYAMEAIGRVVEAAPDHAGDVLPTLAKGCVDEDWVVRRDAIKAIGRVVAAAPDHAGDVLPTMAKGCVDEDSVVRAEAIQAIGCVVAATPDHAGEVLPTLAKGCVDKVWGVRHHAMEAFGRAVAAAPDHAREVLPTLAKGCVDEDSGVRCHAMEAIGRVVAAAPDHAGEVLPTLAKGCVDENSGVRCHAMEAIGRVVAAAPDHAGEVLPTLAKGCVDENSDVRNSTKTALNRIKHEEIVLSAMSILPAYKAGGSLFCFLSRSFTLNPLTKRETVAFVMHVTSSREIGTWGRDDIDLYVGFLRREFNEEFPGLLEYIETKALVESPN